MNQRLQKSSDALMKVQETCNDDIQKKIEDTKHKNELIMKKLIVIFGKFEELVNKSEGRGLLKPEHDTLNEHYNNTLKKIEDPKAGLLKKLRDLK